MQQGDSSIGQVIDGFRILEVLGKGGMGIVYKAEDIALSRTVAIKMIAPELSSNEAFLRRFRSEAQALARVESPFIVGVHALRQVDESFFIVMEYVDGWTLADDIEKGVIEFTRARSVLSQMLQAFAKAHSVGVIHRDIKPRNIMITGAGRVKVTDFGLAKLRRGDEGHSTVTQGMAGTARYMSPEQVLGTSIDHRSDLYSLGMTMYEMLAGVLPFGVDEGTFVILKRIVEEDLPSPLEYNPNIPKPLVDIIQRAIKKNPADRFQTAKEMLDALNTAYDGQKSQRTIPTPQPSRIDIAPELPPIQTSPEKSKKPIWIGVAVLAALLLIYPISLLFDSGNAEGIPSLAEQGGGPANASAIDDPMQFAELMISSIPAGATVVVDREPVGVASASGLSVEVPEGQVNIALQLEGYEPLDTLIVVTAAALNRVELPLAKVRMAQNTTQQNTTQQNTSRQNTEPAPTQTSSNTTPVNTASGNPPSSGENSSATGTVSLAAVPGGSIYVDGQRYQDNVRGLSLQAGTHNIRYVDTRTGTEKETKLDIKAGESRNQTIYFEHLVTITVKWDKPEPPPWASIYINGKDVGWPTPLADYELHPGEYEISLSRNGFELSPPQRLVLEPTFDKSRLEHKLVFEIQKAQN